MLESFPFSDVDDDQFAVLADFIGVAEKGVELDRHPLGQLIAFVGQRDLQLPPENPQKFVIIAVKFRLGELGALPGKRVHCAQIAVADSPEEKVAGFVFLLPDQMRGLIFRQGDQVGKRHPENPGDAVERIHFRRTLVAFQFGDHAGGDWC